MKRTKEISILIIRLTLVFFAMLIAYFLSTMIIGETIHALTPEETSQAGRGLILVSLISALVLSFLILRSPWYGLKLVGGVILVQFGVETFMAQIETLYFNNAVQMGVDEFVIIVAAGAVRAIIFAPLAVFILGKMKKPIHVQEPRTQEKTSKWGKKFIALVGLYFIVYFAFGYFVAWQTEETRLFYSGTAAIKPFVIHFWDLFLKEDPAIVPFQLIRGAFWTAIAYMIVRMMEAKRWQVSLAVALTFAVLISLPIGLFPNPYMPPEVARSHFLELSSSMLFFGAVAGWIVYTSHVRKKI